MFLSCTKQQQGREEALAPDVPSQHRRFRTNRRPETPGGPAETRSRAHGIQAFNLHVIGTYWVFVFVVNQPPPPPARRHPPPTEAQVVRDL